MKTEKVIITQSILSHLYKNVSFTETLLVESNSLRIGERFLINPK